MESKTNFDLIEILRAIKTKRNFVIILTLLGLIASAIFVGIREKEYRATATFLVKSSTNLDRKQMFGEKATDTKSFYASDYEVDKVLTILQSDGVVNDIAKTFDFKNLYNLSSDEKVVKRLKKLIKSERNDNNDIEISFIDKDSTLSYEVVKRIYYTAENMYKYYFYSFNEDMLKEIDFKLVALNDSITNYENRIAETRATFGLRNELLPTRGNATVNNVGGNADVKGLELLHELVFLKDRMVTEKGEYLALKAQYMSTSDLSQKLRLFYPVTEPSVPKFANNIPSFIVVLSSGLICFLVGCIFAVVIAGYKRL